MPRMHCDSKEIKLILVTRSPRRHEGPEIHMKNVNNVPQGFGTNGKRKSQTIACAAGHSGGHIIPCLTLTAQELKDNENRCLFFSTTAALDAQILKNNPLVDTHIALHVTPPRHWSQAPGHLLRMLSAFFKSFFYLARSKPSKIITTGGLVAVPVCIAAWILRIPIELYELNAVPGKAVKFLAPFATRIFVCFANATKFFPSTKCSRVNYPLRADYISQTKDEVMDKLKFDSSRKTVFILGGSQGSHFINRAIALMFGQHADLQTKLQIIHQTGASDATDYAAIYRELNIPAHVFQFASNLAPFYAVADLVIARAGAGTIFETLYFKKPCILIPLETHATDHQVDNAQAIAKEYPELFTMIKQSDCTPSILPSSQGYAEMRRGERGNEEIEKNFDNLGSAIKKMFYPFVASSGEARSNEP
jgi:UDP-N-acetylglucosamine--N-acetylmuramyl-(pentapeptide) pyrophosphoryl-undecaprenol N-acetylglucosamine transferase